MKRFLTLMRIELKLTLRSGDILLFVMAMPVVIVVLVGLIYPEGSGKAGAGMLGNTFGAFLAVGICAVGLMGLPLGLAENRHRKVLKRLKVTPASPGLLLGVQVAVSGLMAVISALLAGGAAVLLFGIRIQGGPGRLAAAWLLVLMAIFSIGLMVASTARDMKKAGMVCSILYFPMLLLSGTTVPYPVFPEVLQKAGAVLPVRQGIILLNGVSSGARLVDFPLQLAVLGGLALVCTAIAIRTFRWDMD